MRSRFPLASSDVENCVDRVLRCLTHEKELVDAFKTVASAKLKAQNANDVKRHLNAILIDPQMPWVFLDMISALVQSTSGPVREALLRQAWVPTGRMGESLRVNEDGRWQVSWLFDETAAPEDQYLAVDLYSAPDKENAPIIPIPVVDYVAGGVSLLQLNLTLPALAILLIALESVLWEILEQHNHSRSSVRVTYKETTWTYKIVANQLVISVHDADAEIKGMKGGPNSTGTITLRKLHDDGGRTRLACDVDSAIVTHIASEIETGRDETKEKGLAEAIQRALAAGLLETLASPLDETLYRLRNHLIHLPSGDVLDPPVPLPSGGELASLREIQLTPHLAKGLVRLIVRTINHVYSLSSDGST